MIMMEVKVSAAFVGPKPSAKDFEAIILKKVANMHSQINLFLKQFNVLQAISTLAAKESPKPTRQ